jgi:hypothetical protein
MRIQRALGIARGAGGVADRGTRAFIELRPVELRLLHRDQCLVAIHIGNCIERRHVVRIGHADPGLDVRAVSGDLLDQRRESAIEKEHPVFRMVDDVNQLLEMQARIAGVYDQSTARHRIINLNVAVIVPSERRDRGARRQSQVEEGVRESFDARRALRKGVAKHRSVGFARNDLHLAVLRLGMLED